MKNSFTGIAVVAELSLALVFFLIGFITWKKNKYNAYDYYLDSHQLEVKKENRTKFSKQKGISYIIIAAGVLIDTVFKTLNIYFWGIPIIFIVSILLSIYLYLDAIEKYTEKKK